jgi:hypothetical protein
MKDKIIQISSSSYVGSDNQNYSIVYGLSRSGKVYHLSENHDKWVLKAESPVIE